MKSLHQFMAEKGLMLAVRLYANLPTIEKVNLKTTLGKPAKYRLLSIPLYLAENIGNLIDRII
jgi:hypothetical protein